jgi:LysR family nitrogen assimilation transcriptional regulator
VQRIGEELPDVAVRIMDGWTGFIVEWLLLGRLDIGVIYDYATRSNLLQVEPLATERQFLVCKAGDPVARHPRAVTLKDLSALPLVLPSREHGLRLAFERQMETAGLSPRVDRELESVIAIKQLVQNEAIYSVLPHGEIANELAAGRLAAVKTKPALERTLSLAWPRERTVDEAMRGLIGMIRNETERLIESGAWGSTFLGPGSAAAARGGELASA